MFQECECVFRNNIIQWRIISFIQGIRIYLVTKEIKRNKSLDINQVASQNRGAGQCVLRSISLLILFAMGRNYQSSGRNQPLCLFKRI